MVERRIEADRRHLDEIRKKHGRHALFARNEDQTDDDPMKFQHVGWRSEKFKILLTFIQVFSQFKRNYGIRWPFLTVEESRLKGPWGQNDKITWVIEVPRSTSEPASITYTITIKLKANGLRLSQKKNGKAAGSPTALELNSLKASTKDNKITVTADNSQELFTVDCLNEFGCLGAEPAAVGDIKSTVQIINDKILNATGS